MSKVIYTENNINPETGEVEQKRFITRQVKDNETFYRTYAEDLGSLLKCSKGEIHFIVCVLNLRFVEYNTNEVVLNTARRKDISGCSGLSEQSIYNFVSSLKRKQILIQKDKHLYLNPKLFFFGSDIEREKIFELTIKYKLNPTEKI